MVVAPLAGAWIEIVFETLVGFVVSMSLPSRERGLKLYDGTEMLETSESLPSRERGLKLEYRIRICRR